MGSTILVAVVSASLIALVVVFKHGFLKAEISTIGFSTELTVDCRQSSKNIEEKEAKS